MLSGQRRVTVLGAEGRKGSLDERKPWRRRVQLRRDAQRAKAQQARFPRVAGAGGETVERVRRMHGVRKQRRAVPSPLFAALSQNQGIHKKRSRHLGSPVSLH